MTEHKHVRVFAFAGLPGSHVSTIIQHLSEKGIPKVTRQDIVSQINHLAEAGQHHVMTDELDSLDLFKTMKHEFPGQLTIIGVISDRNIRHNRLIHQDKAVEDDWAHDQTDRAAVIGMSDHFIIDNDSEETLLRQLNDLLTKIDFYTN